MLQVGDKVKILRKSNTSMGEEKSPEWIEIKYPDFTGFIIATGDDWAKVAKTKDGGGNYFAFNDVEKINPMNSLSAFLRRTLSSDTKALVKAGFMDEKLQLTTLGRDTLLAILFESNKSALVEAAREVIEENEE